MYGPTARCKREFRDEQGVPLAEVAAWLAVREVRCTRCERRGRYGPATLVEHFGGWWGERAAFAAGGVSVGHWDQ